MFTNAVNKNRIPCAYVYIFKEIGSNSGDQDCHCEGDGRIGNEAAMEEKLSILSWTTGILLGTVKSNLFVVVCKKHVCVQI